MVLFDNYKLTFLHDEAILMRTGDTLTKSCRYEVVALLQRSRMGQGPNREVGGKSLSHLSLKEISHILGYPKNARSFFQTTNCQKNCQSIYFVD
jgi:hypothetical protein